jgi:XTP/dITP diphosphohydrolase
LKAFLCSANEHKLAEMRELLPELALEPLAADYPPEGGDTYLDNARIKARFGRMVGPAGAWMLADDSGIEVAALGGAPGVATARWAQGEHVERLLEALDGETDRSARYVCELVCLSPEGVEARGTGILEGSIPSEAAGGEGFGFDPVFVPAGESRTVAELGDAWKALHSHRALAARALRTALGRSSTGSTTS